MRFKVDENVHPEAVSLLRAAGHEAVSVWDQDMRGQSDAVIAEVSRVEQRILLTQDLDFSDIRAYPPNRYSGIIVLRLADQGRRQVLSALGRVVKLLASQPIERYLWIVTESAVRIHGVSEPR